MLLIILYGPPASGKQTVGKALSELTGFPLLHNHLIADLASSIFEYGTEEYVSLSKDLRIRALKVAIESDKPGIIMTFAYGSETKEGKDDDKILRHLQALVKRSKGKVIFIQLISERNTLVARVSSKSRKVHNKLTSKNPETST